MYNILNRKVNPPKTHSFFLFGARGTGKTTLLKENFIDSETLYLDLLKSELFRQLSLKPATLEQMIDSHPTQVKRVIIDEVQRIPSLLNEVHRLIEERATVQFILTGSSSRKLKRGGANLLAGRAYVYHLHPFIVSELKDNFDLETALKWGMLPTAFTCKEDWERKEYLLAYADTYLKEEILQEQLIRNLLPFQRFLPIAAQTSGERINYRKIAKDVGAAPQTVQSYFQILEDTLIGFFLPSFHPSVRKQERVAPKFYIFDPGVKRSLGRQLDTGLVHGTYAFGKAFEHLVIQQIVAMQSYARKQDKLCYYQTQGGVEIDLVIDRAGSTPILVEIKSTDLVREDHVKHLNSVSKDLPESEAYCFSMDPIRKKIGNATCVHWSEGLSELFGRN